MAEDVPAYVAASVSTDGLAVVHVHADPTAAVRCAFEYCYGYVVRSPAAEAGARDSLRTDGEWGCSDGSGRTGYVWRVPAADLAFAAGPTMANVAGCDGHAERKAAILEQIAAPAGVAESDVVYVTATRDRAETEALLSALRNDRRTAGVEWHEQLERVQ